MSQKTVEQVLGVVALLVMLGSCSSAQGRTPPAAVNPQTVGDLPRALASMTTGDLWQEASALGWLHGIRQQRECAKGVCRGRIDAVAEQEPPGATRIGQHGTIVARFANLGAGGLFSNKGPERKYGTAKGRNRASFLIALPSGANDWAWVVVAAEENGTDLVTIPAPAAWRICDMSRPNPNHPPAGTKSQFYKCAAYLGPSPAPASDYNITDPGWLDCDRGCCTAGY